MKLQFTWPDRRPIGIWHLSDPSWVRAGNPSGWNSSDEGLPRWDDNYLDVALPVLSSIGAQGVIIWDIEGSSLGLPLQYVGAPDLAPSMNPQVNYSHFFRRIRSAGFLPGVCLRPTDIINGGHVLAADPYANLERKIAFAREGPWKCRLFYIDSNVRDEWPRVPNSWVEGLVLPATLFARLHQRFPDCLFIPEHKDLPYHLWTIPYREAAKELATPQYILNDIPTAVSAFNLNGLSPEQLAANWGKLNSGGNILLLNASWEDPNIIAYKSCLNT